MKLNKALKETIRNSILINDRVDTILTLELLEFERLKDIIFEIWKEQVYNNEGVYHLRNDEIFINNDGDFIIYNKGGIQIKSDNEYAITYNIIKHLLKFESIQPKRFEITHQALMDLKGEIDILNEEIEEYENL